MKPEVVVFDLGKVLVHFDFSIAARQLAANCAQTTAEAVQRLIDQSPLLFRYESGAIPQEQFYKEVCSCTGYRGELSQFATEFGNIFAPIDEMIELHGRLRAKKVPTFIFSNTNDLALAHIRKHYPFFAHFDGYVFSFEHGAMKPDPKLYEVVEKMTGRKGAQILYLDDRLENIETGRARGWQTIHHRDPAESIGHVEKLGLLD